MTGAQQVRSADLSSDNTRKLLVELSAPAVAGMFVMAFYNVIDTIFVGHGVGTLGIAGLSIVFPIQMAVMATGILFGMGGASVLSRFLGRGDMEGANRTYGTVFVSAVVSGSVLAALGTPFADGILRLFGASGDILSPARDYYGILILASPLFVTAITGNNVLRSVGMARSAMATMMLGAVVNILLDPIFIFGLRMGVKGAALATVIAQTLSVAFLLRELRSSRCSLTFPRGRFPFDGVIFREAAAIGAGSFIRNVAGSFVFALFNNRLLIYGSETSVAAFGVTIRVVRLLVMPLIGLAQGLQPIVGFNFGAERPAKVVEASRHALVLGSWIALVGFGLVQLFPREILKVFSSDAELVAEGARAMRIMTLGLWALGLQMVGTTIFLALGRVRESLLLSMSREVLLLPPLLLVVPPFLGMDGIWLASPISDLLSTTLTAFLLVSLWKRSFSGGAGAAEASPFPAD